MIAHFADRDAVFFDFDGVLVDSCEVKARAFAALYADDHPGIVADVLAYHQANMGVVRHKKFEYFERTLLSREPTPERLGHLCEKFEAAVVEAVIACPEISGAGQLLQDLNAARTPCYVASGTPEPELRTIVERRGLTRHFRAVRGAPAEKHEILTEETLTNGHDLSRCLMVGDAMTDYKAARAVGMPFLGVVPEGAASPFPADVLTLTSFVNA